MNVKVFRIVDIPIWPRLDVVKDARFEIEQNGTRNIASVVGLVEEDVFTVATFNSKVF
jgi:hypothetical protein